MLKLQINPTAETVEILNNLSQKNTKSIFVNMAIKNFVKTKEAKAFLKSDEKKEQSNKPIKNEVQKANNKKISLKEWD